MLDLHFRYISENFKTIFPTKGKIPKNSICLVFDDAYADFYILVFPLLKKYNIKALLAVPTKYILQTTSNTRDKRLSYKHDDLFKNFKNGTFCTFEELREMQDSGLVHICSHSHTHSNLCEVEIDLDEELKLSKDILEKELDVNIDTFVFPFGKYNKNILQKTNDIYEYSFRIGNAVHKDFSGINGVNYRISGDSLKSPDEIFKFYNILSYKLKGFIKKVRND